jgi:hypothetical protein
MPALAAFAPRQPAMNLAPMLEYIEMAPDQLLGVIVAESQPTILGATLAFP